MEKGEVFFKKVNYIFNRLSGGNIDKFTTLFDNKKTDLNNRKIYIESKWLKKPLVPRKFKSEYNLYPFSKLELHGKAIFDGADEFLSIGLKEFKETIDEYIKLDSGIDLEKFGEFRYIYLPNFIGDEFFIDYYSVDYSLLSVGEISVEPPKKKSYLGVENYSGKITKHQSFLIFSFSNRIDYMALLFNLEFVHKGSDYVVGVGMGVADTNNKIPVAKKAILANRVLSSSEVERLYRTINESDIIGASENLLPVMESSVDLDREFFKRYYNKANRLKRLFSKLKSSNFYELFYYRVLFKEFSSIEQMFYKVSNLQTYYLYNRDHILKEVLLSYKSSPFKRLFLSMPIFNYNLFESQTSAFFKIKEMIIELSNNVEIEIVFVVSDCKAKFSVEFEKFLKEFEGKIEVYFVAKDSIENIVNSYDFIFTDSEDFVVAKEIRDDNPAFNVFIQKQTVWRYEVYFKKIKNRAIVYKDFVDKKESPCQRENPVLESLVGRWNFYLYGTQKFWESVLEFGSDGSVVLISEEKTTDVGELIIKKKQCIVILEDLSTDNSMTLMFDNSLDNLKNAFIVNLSAKGYKTSNNLLLFAIASKEPINKSDIQKLLGGKSASILYPNGEIRERLNGYLVEKFGYY